MTKDNPMIDEGDQQTFRQLSLLAVMGTLVKVREDLSKAADAARPSPSLPPFTDDNFPGFIQSVMNDKAATLRLCLAVNDACVKLMSEGIKPLISLVEQEGINDRASFALQQSHILDHVARGENGVPEDSVFQNSNAVLTQAPSALAMLKDTIESR